MQTYGATYEIKVVAAASGEVLHNETIEVPSERCPTFVMFSDDEEITDWYDSTTDRIAAIVAPFVDPQG
ncbi:MAG: hypothetical protein R2715_17945 [Ilumatobacteraceae bacterium]